MTEWIFTSPQAALMIAISTAGIFATLVIFTRISGLRSFSKMSALDFAITIAVGSVIASTLLSKSISIGEGVVALGSLFAIQTSLAFFRKRSDAIAKLIDNDPRLLMRNGEFIQSALTKTNVTEADIIAKLREANVMQFSQVLAVVLETTGDISVLHSSEPDAKLQPDLLRSVIQ